MIENIEEYIAEMPDDELIELMQVITDEVEARFNANSNHNQHTRQ